VALLSYDIGLVGFVQGSAVKKTETLDISFSGYLLRRVCGEARIGISMRAGGLDRQTRTHSLPSANYSHTVKPSKNFTLAHEIRYGEMKQQINQEISLGLTRYIRA